MQNEKIKVRISDIVYSIIKDKRLIAVCALLGILVGIVLAALGYIRGEMSKQYKITSSVAVVAKLDTGQYASRYDNPTKDDISLAKDLTDTAKYVISSDMTVKATIEQMEMVGVSKKSIQSNLKLTQYNETQIIEMALTWRSEEEGIRILSTLTDVSNETLLNTLNVGSVHTINSPSATYIFGGSIKITTIIYATVLGLIIGIAICIIKLLTNPKLLKAEDIESLFGLEIMGKIPYSVDFADASPLSDVPEDEKMELVNASRVLTNRLSRAQMNRIYFTSTERGEGKTKIVAELAAKIASFGKKVLLVDCNFKSPSLASLFKIEVDYNHSLNALYNGDCDGYDAVIRINGCLDMLSCILEEKSEYMYDALPQILPEIFDAYDYVLIDTDAIGKNSEIIMLNEVTEAAFFIVKHDGASVSDIKKALLKISKSGIPTAGCIVNATKTWRNVVRDVEKLAKKAQKRREKKEAKKEKKKKEA